MKTLKPGDVVVIEWNKNCTDIPDMKKLSGSIGVIKSVLRTGHCMAEISDKYHRMFYWHPTSLTKIGKL